MGKNTMERTELYLPKDLKKWLMKRAKTGGTSMAAEIRRIIAEYKTFVEGGGNRENNRSYKSK